MSQSDTTHIPIRYKCVTPRNTSEAISLVEFCKQYHVERSTVRYWLKRHQVRGYKIGGRWYIYVKEFRRSDLKSRDPKTK